MDTTERREKFLLVCLEGGVSAEKALGLAQAMEDFIVHGTVTPLMLAPPLETIFPTVEVPAAEEQDDGPEPSTDTEDLAALSPQVAAVAAPVAPVRRGRKSKWTPELVKAFEDLWAEGADAAFMAKKFGTSKGGVYARANSMGLGRRGPQGKARGAARSARARATWPGPPRDAVGPTPESIVVRRKETHAPHRPPPDTSEITPLGVPDGEEATDIEGVIRFLQSRDMLVEKDPNSIKRDRWLVEGRRDQALTKEELISYANKERRRIRKRPLVYMNYG